MVDRYAELLVPRHIATCSGPVRTAERALPCDGRISVVHASLHGSSILRSCSLAVTLIIAKEVRVARLCLYSTAPASSYVALCLLGVGVLSWFSSPTPRPVAVHCQCADSSPEPLLVDQPRSHEVPSPGVEWPILLGVSVLSFCVGCSGAAALFLPCGFAASWVRHVQYGQGPPRAPLYEAPEGTVIRFPRPRSLTGS